MQADLLAKLKALAEPTRLRIVSLLSQGELTVSEIMQVLGQSQPRVSRHLKLLADAGLCERFPEGGWVFYRLMRTGPVSRLAAMVEEFTDGGDPQVQRDHQRLAELKRARALEAAKYFEAAATEWSHIRALHFSESAVEAALVDLTGGRRFAHHVDVGTGTGRMLELFRDQAEDGMGVDLSREMLHVARAKLSEAGLSNRFVRQADASALPLDAGAADLVTVHQVSALSARPPRRAGRVRARAGAWRAAACGGLCRAPSGDAAGGTPPPLAGLPAGSGHRLAAGRGPDAEIALHARS
jgi:DNA-binding transcriptional ArsR family regulator